MLSLILAFRRYPPNLPGKDPKDFYRPAEVDLLIGDSAKIKNSLSWAPKIKIDELIKIMCEYQLKGILK